MVHKEEVITFFDHCASTWDAEMIKSDEIIGTIMDNAGVGKGSCVLDVACGTGVLFPYYRERNVASVTGIDISSQMTAIARDKVAGEANMTVICADAEQYSFDRKFDVIMVYNAFPHFEDGARLIGKLSAHLAPGGRFSIAHGMSRDCINAHHHGAAQHVSNGLPEAESVSKLMAQFLEPTVCISNDRMYQVVGVNR